MPLPVAARVATRGPLPRPPDWAMAVAGGFAPSNPLGPQRTHGPDSFAFLRFSSLTAKCRQTVVCAPIIPRPPPSPPPSQPIRRAAASTTTRVRVMRGSGVADVLLPLQLSTHNTIRLRSRPRPWHVNSSPCGREWPGAQVLCFGWPS
jgi:hypothetical protein